LFLIVKLKIKFVFGSSVNKKKSGGGWISVPDKYNLLREFTYWEQNVILNKLINKFINSLNK